jgi:mannose-6-phosphate isomerase-like protein (cupin superfamily)
MRRYDRAVTDERKWRVARLDEIERRDRDIPVREHFGISAFGVTAFVPSPEGVLISEHTEAGSGQEELYVVLEGHATFEIDGETVDAPAGTFVSLRPEARRKATGEGTVLTIGAKPGEAYQPLDWGGAWEFHRESMKAYGEERYADALAAVRRGLAEHPEQPGLNFNYACFSTLAGEVDDETFSRLRRSVELHEPFRAQARDDEDLAALRDDARFEDALR